MCMLANPSWSLSEAGDWPMLSYVVVEPAQGKRITDAALDAVSCFFSFTFPSQRSSPDHVSGHLDGEQTILRERR